MVLTYVSMMLHSLALTWYSSSRPDALKAPKTSNPDFDLHFRDTHKSQTLQSGAAIFFYRSRTAVGGLDPPA